MHIWIKFVILMTCMGVFWCFSESFLATEKPPRPRSTQQLKQDIVEVMGALLEQESEAIEMKAKTQGALCKHIKAFASGDKKSFFARATAQQLQQTLKVLSEEKVRLEKERVQSERLLSVITSSMV